MNLIAQIYHNDLILSNCGRCLVLHVLGWEVVIKIITTRIITPHRIYSDHKTPLLNKWNHVKSVLMDSREY